VDKFQLRVPIISKILTLIYPQKFYLCGYSQIVETQGFAQNLTFALLLLNIGYIAIH